MALAWLPIAALPLLAGAVMLLVSARLGRAEDELHRTGRRTGGTVAALVERSAPGGGTAAHAQVRFRTEGGRSVRGVSENPLARAYPVGAAIEVRYDPRRPARFVAGPSAARMYRVAGRLLVASGVMALAAIVALTR